MGHIPCDETQERHSAHTGTGVPRGAGTYARGNGPAGSGAERGKRWNGYWLFGGISALLVLAVVGYEVSHSPRTPPRAQLSVNGPASQRTAPAGQADDGGIPSGRDVTPFDTQYSAISRLAPDLLKAVQQADNDAKGAGITFRVTSGWRSKAHQQRLLDDAMHEYGSLRTARQYVNTPEKSTHVQGKAVDIGPTDADDWLIQHGSRYGLCQVYANEMWHFEMRTAPGGTCPALLNNATD
ncbi:M15 family metallopeptidase [Streptomyces sp. NBC_00433]